MDNWMGSNEGDFRRLYTVGDSGKMLFTQAKKRVSPIASSSIFFEILSSKLRILGLECTSCNPMNFL